MSPEERERLVRLETQVSGMEKTLSEIRKDVRETRDIMLNAKGGWKTLLIVGSIAAAIGGAVAKLFALLSPT